MAEMEEVVVNGYFTKNKDSFTGNAVVVSKDELAKVSSNNLLSALQVFDPSFRLKDNVDMGSNPNSMPNFRIRGNSGFGAEGLSEANLKNDPNLPTFILDGYEVDVEKINDRMPLYKRIKRIFVTDEPMIKTSTSKVRRFLEIEKMLEEENKDGGTHGKQI